MMKLLLKIRYLGTHYCGYQVQPNAVSIQQRLNEATKALFGYDCDIVGCSRTDSGVHANMFCATVARRGTEGLDTAIPADRIPQALSAHLPWDISVYGAEWVSPHFHARYDVAWKEYVYRIVNASVRDPFYENRAAHLPKRIDDAGLAEMQRAAAYLVGTHDFSSYMAQGSLVTSTVRTVKEIAVEREGDLLTLRFSADGFLYNMVRILVGTLVEVGQGKLSAGDIPHITEAHDRSLAGMTMPACGLYLNRVYYREEDKHK